jgi:hypothetical protein
MIKTLFYLLKPRKRLKSIESKRHHHAPSRTGRSAQNEVIPTQINSGVGPSWLYTWVADGMAANGGWCSRKHLGGSKGGGNEKIDNSVYSHRHPCSGSQMFPTCQSILFLWFSISKSLACLLSIVLAILTTFNFWWLFHIVSFTILHPITSYTILYTFCHNLMLLLYSVVLGCLFSIISKSQHLKVFQCHLGRFSCLRYPSLTLMVSAINCHRLFFFHPFSFWFLFSAASCSHFCIYLLHQNTTEIIRNHQIQYI